MSRLEDEILLLEVEDLDQAMRMTPSQKLRAGADLFDDACRTMIAGIRQTHPGISQVDAVEFLRKRLELEEAWEKAS